MIKKIIDEEIEKNLVNILDLESLYNKTLNSNNIEHLSILRLQTYPYFKGLNESLTINKYGRLSFVNNYNGINKDEPSVTVESNYNKSKYEELSNKLRNSESFYDFSSSIDETDIDILKKTNINNNKICIDSFIILKDMNDNMKDDNFLSSDKNPDYTMRAAISKSFESYYVFDSEAYTFITTILSGTLSIDNSDRYLPSFLIGKDNPAMKKMLEKFEVYDENNKLISYNGLEDFLNKTSLKNTTLGIIADRNLSVNEKIIKLYDKLVFNKFKQICANELELTSVMPSIDDLNLKYNELLDNMFNRIEKECPIVFHERNNNLLSEFVYLKNDEMSREVKTNKYLNLGDLAHDQKEYFNSFFKGKMKISKDVYHYSLYSTLDSSNYLKEVAYLKNDVEIFNFISCKTFADKSYQYEPKCCIIEYMLLSEHEDLNIKLFNDFLNEQKSRNKPTILAINTDNKDFTNNINLKQFIDKNFNNDPRLIVVDSYDFSNKFQALIQIINKPNFNDIEKQSFFNFGIEKLNYIKKDSYGYINKEEIEEMYINSKNEINNDILTFKKPV